MALFPVIGASLKAPDAREAFNPGGVPDDKSYILKDDTITVLLKQAPCQRPPRRALTQFAKN